MTAYNATQIMEKILEKTNSRVLVWNIYNLANDSNPYSSKYFSTIKNLQINNGYFVNYFNGRMFLFPDINGLYYLFIQASPDYLPFVFISPGALDSKLLQLRDTITSFINPIDAFLNQLLS